MSKDDLFIPKVLPGECVSMEDSSGRYRYVVEWISSHGIICDLDVNVMCYDERSRFIEKLSSESHTSRDESCILQNDIDVGNQLGSFLECVTIDFRKVDHSTQAILVYLDGGPRNFQYIQQIIINCLPTEREDGEETFHRSSTEKKTASLFSINGRCRKDYQGILLIAIYKDGWDSQGNPQWIVKSLMEPMHVSAVKEKEDLCEQTIISTVPALEKFKPKLFVNVRAICSALSSHALPRLKNKFVSNGALSIGQFTEVLFKQLATTHPRVTDDSEAGFTVAMLQEMFHQIDFNGDTTVDWDEFTTFCIQTGLQVSTVEANQSDSLDEYVIEYGEELLLRDRVLSPHRYITLMRHVPETRKLLVIPEDSDKIFIFDERFKLKSHLYPSKLVVIGENKLGKAIEPTATVSENPSSVTASTTNQGRIMIYDAIYLASREFYAYCASDHTITIVKEQVIGARVNYIQHNRFYHSLLHVKLCWSAKSKVLCSVASDKVIYGWDIDGEKPLFQISRHSDLITDMISIDHHELFATCSMDKRIVLWSSSTRRVKGVLLGHKRGVRCLDVFENNLLSAGFETEAKTWDIVSKDCIAVLKGHRRPVAAAKLMCQRAQTEEEHRAITVDEGGEFRLWNIFVKERSADAALVPTLQIFEMNQPENPINCMRFLALPNDPILSTSYYSNLIACSTKLLHFLPEKNAKEFLPPTACVFNESAACIVTAVGKSVMKYDICTGHFITSFPDVASHDLTAFCLDGDRGRRLFIGCSNGEFLLINFMTGAVLGKTQAHNREITCISATFGARHNIYTCSLDGKLRMLEEEGGVIHVHNSVDNAFGEGIGIQFVQIVELLTVVVAVSVEKKWGIWNSRTFKRIALFEEERIITACQIIGTTLDEVKQDDVETTTATGEVKKVHGTKAPKKEKLLTLALAFGIPNPGIYVYTLDIIGIVGIASFFLKPEIPMEISQLEKMKFMEGSSMNYSVTRGVSALSLGSLLVGCSDDGHICTWELNTIRKTSEMLFHLKFDGVKRKEEKATDIGFMSGTPSRMPSPRAPPPQEREEDFELALAKEDTMDVAPPPKLSRAMNRLGSVIDNRLLNRIEAHAGSDLPDIKPVLMTASETEESNEFDRRESELVEKLNMLLLEDMQFMTPAASAHFSHSSSGIIAPSTGKTDAITAPASAVGIGSATGSAAGGIAAAALEHNNSNYIYSFELFGLPPPEAHKLSYKCWRGHGDEIPIFIPLHEHGCIVTVSLDGYHRVWNMDSVCLGEMPLPNITESMKNPAFRCVKKTVWKFILERIPVSAFHKQLALQLSNEILQKSRMNTGITTAPRRGGQNMASINLNSKGLLSSLSASRLTFTSEDSFQAHLDQMERTKNRSDILRSLSEAPTLPDDAPPLVLSQHRLDKHKGAKSFDALPTADSTFSPKPTTAGSTMSVESGVLPALRSPIRTPKGALSRPDSHKSSDGFRTPKTPKLLSGLENSTVSDGGSIMLSGRKSQSRFKYHNDESLWQLPSELKSASDFAISPAFSDASLFLSHQMGNIDGEGYRILRKVAAHHDKVSVYDRASSVLLLRNPAMSLSCEMPTVDEVRASEVNFGAQKGMYKNADKLLGERESMPKSQMRHIISLARIEQNVRKVHTMVHVMPPPAHDDVVLPKNSTTDPDDPDELLRNEELKTKMRLDMSASMVSEEARSKRRPLNMNDIQQTMNKLTEAVNTNPEWENRLRESFVKKEAVKRKNNKEKISVQARDAIEKRLALAIKSKFKYDAKENSSSPTNLAASGELKRTAGTEKVKKEVLTNRALLPSYKMVDVRNFLEIFNRTDEDYTGDLNIEEWVKLFALFGKTYPPEQSRLLFLNLVKNEESCLTFRDIVPIVFSKADAKQLKLIIHYLEGEIQIMSTANVRKHPCVSAAEIDQLFDCYDTENIGFVGVSYIKDRIKDIALPESVVRDFMDTIADLEEDEMVNNEEFLRIFKVYCSLSSLNKI